MGGQHIGHLVEERVATEGHVRTRIGLSLLVQRNGTPLRIEASERHEEREDGTPLGFASRLEAGGTRTEVEARVEHGMIEARIVQGDRVSERRLPWPEGALLAEGQRRLLASLPGSGARERRARAFDAAALTAVPLKLVLGQDPPPERPELVRIEQELGEPGAGQRTELWLEPERGEVVQMQTTLFGLPLRMRSCSEACATAPPVAAEVLLTSLVPSPRVLSVRERRRTLWYRVAADGAALAPLSRIPGQRIVRDAEGEVVVAIDPHGQNEPAPSPADTLPSRWLQSDDPEVRALAIRAAAGSTRPERILPRLVRAVREHIRHRSLNVGYASAAEVVRQREGDCTEHAVLLAALARALGIPARVVFGLAYAPAYADREQVFVPHAWVMAWVDGRWVGLEAALAGFDAAHIGLAMGDGEPFDFYGGLDLMGRLRILDITAHATEDR